MATYTFPFAHGGFELTVTCNFSPEVPSPNILEQPGDPEEFTVDSIELAIPDLPSPLDVTDLIFDSTDDEGEMMTEEIYQKFIDWRAAQIEAAEAAREDSDD